MHITRVQRRMGRVALGMGLAMALPALVVWFATVMPLDWHYELPRWARGVFLLAGLGAAAGLGWHFGIRPWRRKPADDQIALAIERALPELQSRFIASVQLSRRAETHAQPLVRALVKDTTERTRGLEFDRVVSTDRLRRCSLVAGVALAVGSIFWLIGGRASWPLFQRAWLLNVRKPSNTEIVSFTGSRVIAIGDDLRISAVTAGIIPQAGRLKLQIPGAPVADHTFDADAQSPGHFLRTLQSVQQSFRYRIELGDTRTPWAEIRARPRPVILQLALEQQWPAYTGLGSQQRSPGDLKLLAGSSLTATLKPNTKLREATIQLLSPNRKVHSQFAATLLPSGEWRGLARIPPKDVSALTFRLADEEGVESRSMANYRIEIVPDEPPSIAVLWPERREELVTPAATLLVAFEAKDDFGIGRIRLHYAVNWVPGGSHQSLDLDVGGGAPKSMNRRFEWDLGRMVPPVKEGDVIDYWFEAVDRNDVTGPGAATMPEHYQARVVSEDEKRADLAARLADTLQGLGDLRIGQEDLARKLGDLIHEKRP